MSSSITNSQQDPNAGSSRVAIPKSVGTKGDVEYFLSEELDADDLYRLARHAFLLVNLR